MVRKIKVHFMLLRSAEKKIGSSKMVRKLSSPAKVGVVAPSHSKNAIATVRNAGMRMITTLMTRAGMRKGIGDHKSKSERKSAGLGDASGGAAGRPSDGPIQRWAISGTLP